MAVQVHSSARMVCIFLGALLVVMNGCASARRRLPFGEAPRPVAPSVSDEQYGQEVLHGLSRRYPLDYDDPRYPKVQEIVERLAAAAGAANDPWHIYLFRDPNFKNAGATRGNHVFVWSGLLDEVQSDDELAAILAHEISHVLARHTERDPVEELKRILIRVGATAAGIAVSYTTKNPTLGGNLGQLTDVLTQEVGESLIIHPYSRELEYEADEIGLFLMANAGYDPRGAVSFWERAKENPAFTTSFEFFSTHPPPADRVEKLRALLPLALSRYEERVRGATPGSTNGERGIHPPMPSTSEAHGSREAFSRPPTTSGEESTENALQGRDWISSEQWRVEVDRVIVYAQPSTASRQLGEFPRGALVRVIAEHGDWLEVAGPDPGYVERSALIPLQR